VQFFYLFVIGNLKGQMTEKRPWRFEEKNEFLRREMMWWIDEK